MADPTKIIKGGLSAVRNASRAADQAMEAKRLARDEALAKLDVGQKLSKAENIVAGLYHPIGEGKKLNVPFSRMTSTVVDNPSVVMHQGKIITPEQAVKDRMGFFPLIGDRADTGKILTHVNNRKAKYETPLTGGGKYMQANYDPVMAKSAGWESGKSKVSTLQGRIEDIVQSGYQPVGVFSPGSHVQVDFNTMMPHALLGQFEAADTTKKLIKQFDKEVKAAYPEWVGITSPEAEAQLMDKGNGVLRTQFTKTMGKDSYQSGGFPDVPSVRKAISDPDLYDTELGTLGQNMALFDPTGALVQAPKNPSAYPLSMSAQNLGKLDQTENFADFFTTANERRRLFGSDPARDYRSFELAQPIQYADEEWLNKLMGSRRLRDEAIKKGGYAEGGEVDGDQELKAMIADHLEGQRDDPELRSMIEGYMAGGEVKGFKKLSFMADGGKIVKGVMGAVSKASKMADETMAARKVEAPSIIIPSKLTELRKTVQKEKGDYGSRRLERAADEIPNLDKLYKEQALKEAFTGDNARALMTMNPAKFEKYSEPLNPGFTDAASTRFTTSGKRLTYPEYMEDYLPNVGAFNDVPFLEINKAKQGSPMLPFISGHEGRHRNRVMADRGDEAGLVQLLPRYELREPFPRRSQEEYIEALKKELLITNNKVRPEEIFEGFHKTNIKRPSVKLPDIYADGGGVHMVDGGKIAKGMLGAIQKASKFAESSMAAKGTRKFEDNAGGLNITKEPGGNWLTGSAGSVERALKPLKREEFIDVPQLQDPATAAINKWVDGNLTNYVKKQMATKDDPVRKLAEEGIVHMPPTDVLYNMHGAQKNRAELGQPQLGQSDAAKAWENNTDSLIDVAPASQYTRQLTDSEAIRGDRSLVDTNPWLSKVAPETQITAIHPDAGKDLGFDHILDVLREDVTSGRMRPEQLNKVSMEQAVRRTHEYDLELAAKMNAANAAKREGLPVYKDYPEGYRWIELNKPGSFSAESDMMGHSVRGYEPPKGHPDWVEGSGNSGSPSYGHGGWEAIKSGKAKVYSLVDSKGAPHATVEIKQIGMTPEQRQYKVGFLASQLEKEGQTAENALRQAERIYPDESKQAISQIKGKQNAAPKEEYLPFVQDFVKSGNWSAVGDLGNTGLIRANAIKGAGHDMTGFDQKYLTKQEYDDLLLKNLQLPMAEGGGAFKTLQWSQRFDNGGIVSPEESSTPPPDTEQTYAGLMAEYLAQAAKDQGREEFSSLKKPRAVTDLINRGVLANNPLSAIIDMVNMGLLPLDALGSKLTGRDIKVSSEKPFLGSEHLKDLMNKYNVTSGEERPMMETALSFASPVGMIKGAQKTADLAKKAPEMVRKAESGLNEMRPAVQRPFTPATFPSEATAPDLGQGTSYGFRQGLNDRLLANPKLGTGKTKAREGQGTYVNTKGELELNPLQAIDVPRAGNIGEGPKANRALRQQVAQMGVDLNQEAMAGHRFLPMMTNNIKDASAMLIKTKEGLSKDQIADLARVLGSDMVVSHNPKLGGVVVFPFGPVTKGQIPEEFLTAQSAASKVLGKDAKIQYGKSDFAKDRLFMDKSEYPGAGAVPMSKEQQALRGSLQGIEKFMFPESVSGIPGSVKASPIGGLQPWSRGVNYPTSVIGRGNLDKTEYQPVNFLTSEEGKRYPSYLEADQERAKMLDTWHRTLPSKAR